MPLKGDRPREDADGLLGGLGGDAFGGILVDGLCNNV